MVRFLVLFLLSLMVAIVAVPRIVEYAYPTFEKAFLDPYEISKHNNPEVALAFELLQATPASEVESLVARLNQKFDRGTHAQLISLKEAEAEIGGPDSRIQQLRSGEPLGKYIGIGQYDVGYLTYVRVRGEDRVLQIYSNPYAAEMPASGQIEAFIWLVRATVVAVVVLFWALPFWSALHKLRAAAKDFSEGRLSSRVTSSRYSVLSPIAAAFNSLAERAEKLILSHKALSGAVAHELRTPITRIRFAQRMGLEAETVEEKNEQLSKIGADAVELEAMTNELLLHEKLYAQTHALQIDHVQSKAICERVLETARQKAEMQAPDITISARFENFDIAGDKVLITRAIQNLVDNAVRHARQRVQITAVQLGEGWAVYVDDDGTGIPESLREQVFEPFFQVDQSRSSSNAGAGLGLAIVLQVARMHGGEVIVEDSAMGGARFSFRVPSQRVQVGMSKW